ncbi:MAG: hypothetical protein NVSMB7_08920 [Chitinophagaceae bacterium]
MFAKVKSPVFIDTLKFEVSAPDPSYLKAVLKDDKDSICGTFETNVARVENELTWRNLNDLPYGVYTLELSHGKDEMKVRLVKRV